MVLKKNMKKTFLYFLVIFYTITYSQNYSKIEYELKIGVGDLKNDSFEKYITLANNGALKLNFILEFNGVESQFYLEDKLTNSDKDSKLAIAMSDYDNLIYYNTNDKEYFYNNRDESIFKKEEFLIKDSILGNWKLSSESKNIQNFVCYKATNTIIYYEGERKFEKNIIAWYCPSLALPIGPYGYGGLPGLILELNIGEILFGIKKISQSENKIKIIKPSRGVVITRNEYMNQIISRRENFMMQREN
jgi:GLPGLI family protein